MTTPGGADLLVFEKQAKDPVPMEGRASIGGLVNMTIAHDGLPAVSFFSSIRHFFPPFLHPHDGGNSAYRLSALKSTVYQRNVAERSSAGNRFFSLNVVAAR